MFADDLVTSPSVQRSHLPIAGKVQFIPNRGEFQPSAQKFSSHKDSSTEQIELKIDSRDYSRLSESVIISMCLSK